ncbi:plastid movement impaired 1-related 1 protein [Tanacetum coccineum]
MKDTRPQRYDVGEPNPEYVSLEDLTTLAMNKIEALSVEGLRIQSGMSDKDAPSNISPQSIGEISALEGIL